MAVKNRRFGAGMLCALFCLMLATSLCCIMMGACHTCVSMRCDICFVVQLSVERLRGFAYLVAAVVLLLLAVRRGASAAMGAAQARNAVSLVSLKVKLSN